MSAMETYIFVNPTYGERQYKGKAAIERAIRGIVYNGATPDEKSKGFSPPTKTLSKPSKQFLTDVYCRLCPVRFADKVAGQRFVFQSVKEPMIGGYSSNGFANRGLRILRSDGSHTQISFLAKSLCDDIDWSQELNAALRQVVAPWIIDYSRTLRAHMNYTPDVGMPVTDDTPLHLDHVDPPFFEIAEAWIKENDLTPSPDLFRPKKDEHRVRLLKDKSLADDFIFYHAMNARLQLITAKGNMQKGARKITQNQSAATAE